MTSKKRGVEHPDILWRAGLSNILPILAILPQAAERQEIREGGGEDELVASIFMKFFFYKQKQYVSGH